MFDNPNPPDQSPEDFSDLEARLADALKPVDPPAGFADRVIARARAEVPADRKPGRILMFPSTGSRLWLGSAIAAMLLVGVAGEQGRRIEQRRKTEEAQ